MRTDPPRCPPHVGSPHALWAWVPLGKAPYWATCYILLLVGMAASPQLAFVDDTFYASRIGTWNMYKTKVEEAEAALLVAPGVTPAEVDIKRYFWHTRFGGNAH